MTGWKSPMPGEPWRAASEMALLSWCSAAQKRRVALWAAVAAPTAPTPDRYERRRSYSSIAWVSPSICLRTQSSNTSGAANCRKIVQQASPARHTVASRVRTARRFTCATGSSVAGEVVSSCRRTICERNSAVSRAWATAYSPRITRRPNPIQVEYPIEIPARTMHWRMWMSAEGACSSTTRRAERRKWPAISLSMSISSAAYARASAICARCPGSQCGLALEISLHSSRTMRPPYTEAAISTYMPAQRVIVSSLTLPLSTAGAKKKRRARQQNIGSAQVTTTHMEQKLSQTICSDLSPTSNRAD
eukprot:2808728-Prymnesium_polylepis.2